MFSQQRSPSRSGPRLCRSLHISAEQLQSQHPALPISPAPHPLPRPWGTLCHDSPLVSVGGHYLKPHYPWASHCLASGWGQQGSLPPHSHILSLQTRVGVGKQGEEEHGRPYQLAREDSSLPASGCPRCYKLSPEQKEMGSGTIFLCTFSFCGRTNLGPSRCLERGKGPPDLGGHYLQPLRLLIFPPRILCPLFT